jgi:lysophospholipase
VADIGALLKDVVENENGPNVAIGHSMGGHLLLRALVEQRPALSAAILVAPMIGINTSPAPAWASHTFAQGMAMAGMSRMPAWTSDFDPSPSGSSRQSILTSCNERYADEIFWIEQQPGFALGAPSWGWLSAAYRSMAMLTADKLKRVETPVLLLGTERDRLVSANSIRWAAGLIPSAELAMLNDAAHEILRETDEVRLGALARIDAFLDEHAG